MRICTRSTLSLETKSTTDQAGFPDIIKDGKITMQRGRKFADGTGYNDLFELRRQNEELMEVQVLS